MKEPSTPIPWQYHPVTLGHPNNRLNPIISTPDFYIARLFSATATVTGMSSRAPGELEEAEANAAFIVRAVNNHAKLLTALTEWHSHVERWHSEGAAGEGRRCTDCIEHERSAHDAIEDVEREVKV